MYKRQAEKVGYGIVIDSLGSPIRQMAKNAGLPPDVIYDRSLRLSSDKGFDFKTGKVVNMTEAGIIDPVEVSCAALINATSAVSTLISTECAIVQT